MDDDSTLIGAVVVDGHGEIIGRAAAVLVDPKSLDARWLSIALVDGASAVLPVQTASVNADRRLVAPFGPVTVAAAPQVVGEVLVREHAGQLLRYYGFGGVSDPPTIAARIAGAGLGFKPRRSWLRRWR